MSDFKTPLTPARESELKSRQWSLLQMFKTEPKPVWAIKELRTIGIELGEIEKEKPVRPAYA